METTLGKSMITNPNFKNPESVRSRFLKSNPSKGFHEFKLDSTTSTPKEGGVVRWYVISSGKRSTLFKYLFLKWLWDELTSQEWYLVLNSPEFFSSKEFVASARALAAGIPKKVIRDRLNKYHLLVGLKPLSQERYRSMKGIRYEFCEFELAVKPAKKFSGWVRHQNDQGSLRVSSVFEIEPSIFTEKSEIDLFFILSVGTVTILNKEVSLSPEDDYRKSKRKNNVK